MIILNRYKTSFLRINNKIIQSKYPTKDKDLFNQAAIKTTTTNQIMINTKINLINKFHSTILNNYIKICHLSYYQ